jgi:hypothetical protein
MADYSVTAASVVKTSTTSISEGIAGATVTAGQAVYIDTADSSKLKGCDADAQASSVCAGIALHGAANGQPLKYATGGSLTFNSAFAAGDVVCVSTTVGGLAPYADLASGDFITVIGIATSATNLRIAINASETAK